MITYPRTCPHCDYVANNAAMFGYHMKTHAPIPPGTVCSGGCGELAKHRTTSGKCWCQPKQHMCNGYRQSASVRVSKQWADNEWTDRRAENAARTRNETPEQTALRAKKQQATKIAKLKATEHSLTKKQYFRAAIYHSRKTYTQYQDVINPSGLMIGRQQYHLEHKVSRHIGFLLSIPLEYICSHHNLTILHHLDNSSKGPTCSMLPAALLELCGAPPPEIERVMVLQLHLINAGVL